LPGQIQAFRNVPRFCESRIQAGAMYRKNTVQEAFPDSKGKPPSMAGGVFLELKKFL